MAALQAKAKAALKAARTQPATGVEGQQTGMVETEEQMRERIGT